MAVKAYQRAQLAAEHPRSTEYRLFGQVTGALIEAQSAGIKGVALIEAIDWNRRLWSTLAVDCMDDANQLSKPLRAQIVSLSLWVSNHTFARWISTIGPESPNFIRSIFEPHQISFSTVVHD